MSDDKKTDGGVADDAAKRLAEQRKALNLQTQPLEVIADLDWGVDDDDAVFVPPPAAEPAKAAPAKSEPAKSEPAEERAPVSSGGTMMMSTADFQQSLGAEPEPVKAPAQEHAAEPEAAPAEEPAAPPAEEEAPQTEGGTMLMSTSAITAQLEQEAGVRAAQDTALEGQDPAADEAASEDASPEEHEPQRPEWDDAPARETTTWANPNAAGGGDVSAPEGRNLLFVAIAVVVAIILLTLILLVVPSGGDSAQVEGAPAETAEEG